ncbi:site-specific DNA-methyltransferase [Allokutzneria sp. A3M-2-11 16]|uniref:DNA methyltransferase n=1 Tax=Allokutzneria sp. A3M-2-11 16 TaxID=2962043 RepID=UPI0020B6D9EE|nr:DNA methyltransferase [Allokutzneria sp. A3M-2-11 16]MCP3800730.1 site-specific DNA-methyltransferase [Allokutzneria sp. A3M-2-11 16]
MPEARRTVASWYSRSVWATGEYAPLTQLRRRGYHPGTAADLDRVPPALAARAITTLTATGDLVLDPACGAGTVLVEAVRAGRHTVGLTPNPRWWTLARANVTAARRGGAWPDACVLDGHPSLLATPHAAGLLGRVDLVLTALRHTEPADTKQAIADLGDAIHASRPLLGAGAHVAVALRPRRHADNGPREVRARVLGTATRAGLALVRHYIALTGRTRGARLLDHPSPTVGTLADRAAQHWELLVFRAPEDLAHVLAAPPPSFLGARAPLTGPRTGRAA